MLWTGRQQNSLRLFCFLPVNPTFVAAFAALKVSFPGACPGKDDFYFDEETTSSRRIRLLECFLFVLLFRFQGAFSRGENEFIKKVRGAASAEVNLLKKCAALLWRKRIYYKKCVALLWR